MGGVPADWVLRMKEIEREELAGLIVDHCLDELAGRSGLDLQEIVQIVKEIREDMIERVAAMLRFHDLA